MFILPDTIVAHVDFVDGIRRAVYEEPSGRQYAIDNDGERAYRVWFIRAAPLRSRPSPPEYHACARLGSDSSALSSSESASSCWGTFPSLLRRMPAAGPHGIAWATL
ncbi:hypothetical protein AYO44_14205 [Planctomycetaceae bacterium SCGC AG-212-F19]|nr:hypothetical protein AYO44_14205 [Planctomycetaceae bacterium SCGC AG-212-F19]